MKIAILGHSGSGKSTLARALGDKYGLPVLHFDAIHFLPGWVETDRPYKREKVTEFLDANPEGWVIDGNYSALYYDRRMEEADLIIVLLFGRLNCLRRVTKRFLQYRGTTRPDMGEGCEEKLDGEFIRWVLHGGRTRKKQAKYKALCTKYKEKTVVIRNQRQLDGWMRKNLMQ